MTYTQELQEWAVKVAQVINEEVKKKGKISIGWFYLPSESHHIDNLILERKDDQTFITYTWKGNNREMVISDLPFNFSTKDVARLADKILEDENNTIKTK